MTFSTGIQVTYQDTHKKHLVELMETLALFTIIIKDVVISVAIRSLWFSTCIPV